MALNNSKLIFPKVIKGLSIFPSARACHASYMFDILLLAQTYLSSRLEARSFEMIAF